MTNQAYKGNILLVEDSPSLASVYQAYLEEDGYATTILESGEAALEYMESQVPDVMLLDLSLPDGHGLDFYDTSGPQHPNRHHLAGPRRRSLRCASSTILSACIACASLPCLATSRSASGRRSRF